MIISGVSRPTRPIPTGRHAPWFFLRLKVVQPQLSGVNPQCLFSGYIRQNPNGLGIATHSLQQEEKGSTPLLPPSREKANIILLCNISQRFTRRNFMLLDSTHDTTFFLLATQSCSEHPRRVIAPASKSCYQRDKVVLTVSQGDLAQFCFS